MKTSTPSSGIQAANTRQHGIRLRLFAACSIVTLCMGGCATSTPSGDPNAQAIEDARALESGYSPGDLTPASLPNDAPAPEVTATVPTPPEKGADLAKSGPAS